MSSSVTNRHRRGATCAADQAAFDAFAKKLGDDLAARRRRRLDRRRLRGTTVYAKGSAANRWAGRPSTRTRASSSRR